MKKQNHLLEANGWHPGTVARHPARRAPCPVGLTLPGGGIKTRRWGNRPAQGHDGGPGVLAGTPAPPGLANRPGPARWQTNKPGCLVVH